jgi:hypothetical protein
LPGFENVRVSFCVQAAQYDERILLIDKKEAERESAEQSSLNSTIYNRVDLRVSAY